MNVRDLMIELSKMDAEVEVNIVKQIDNEYQHIYGIDYINEKHPIGGLVLHVSDHSKTEKG